MSKHTLGFSSNTANKIALASGRPCVTSYNIAFASDGVISLYSMSNHTIFRNVTQEHVQDARVLLCDLKGYACVTSNGCRQLKKRVDVFTRDPEMALDMIN